MKVLSKIWPLQAWRIFLKGFNHVTAPNGNDWHVTDVWESEEAFKKFGETMVPILIKNGGNPVHPVIMPVHNIIIPE